MHNPGILLVLCGPSGAGKGTVVSELLARENQLQHHLTFSVSMTTRAPRPGEIDGKNYYFVSRERFETEIAADAFLEYAEYAGNYYGTPRAPVEAAVRAGQVVLLEIEVKGAQQIHKSFPEAVMVFIIPPSFDELERRLSTRGTETPEVIAQRLSIAQKEFRHVTEFSYLVYNDTVAQAVSELDSILRAEKCRVTRRLHLGNWNEGGI